MWQILLAKLTKKCIQRGQFHQLKNPGDYIAKLKPQGVSLQMTQTPRVIMQFNLIFTVYLSLQIHPFLF